MGRRQRLDAAGETAILRHMSVERAAPFWDAIGALVAAKLDNVAGLAQHGFGPLAADELERRGSPVPDRLRHQQHLARLATLTAPMILERVRAACEGPILLLKGPEVAARYPHRARTFGDVDLLVPDAQRTQRELIAAGFAEEDDPEGIWVGIHHLARLRWQGLELAVEVHSEPKWPDGLTPPPSAELFEAAVPASVGVDGILAPAPSHHALVLAAHAWAHQSIGRARDLVDVGALRSEADEAMLRALARAWRIPRVWNTMSSSLDAVLCGQRTWPLRLWAGHVPELRPQTVLETHVERLVSPFWAYPPPPPRAMPARISRAPSGPPPTKGGARSCSGHTQRFDARSVRRRSIGNCSVSRRTAVAVVIAVREPTSISSARTARSYPNG